MRFQHIKVNDMVELILHVDEIDSTSVKVQTGNINVNRIARYN